MPAVIPPILGIGATSATAPPATAPANALPADVFKGYADLRQSVVYHLNRHLYNAAAYDGDTWRILGGKRKVGR